MGDGGGDDRPSRGGEAAAAVEVVARRREGEQVVNVKNQPENKRQVGDVRICNSSTKYESEQVGARVQASPPSSKSLSSLVATCGSNFSDRPSPRSLDKFRAERMAKC